MCDFLGAGGHLLAAAAVEHVHFLGAEALGHAAGVHRDVAAAQDDCLLARENGGVDGVAVDAAHEVGAGQVFVRGEDADETFARDVREEGKPCAGPDEGGVEAVLFEQVEQRAGAADDEVRAELHAHRRERVELGVDHLVGEAELGDAIAHHAAQLVQGLEDRHLVAGAAAVRGAGQARGAGAHDRHALAGLGRHFRHLGPAAFAGVVGQEALHLADADGLEDVLLGLAHGAVALALAFLRADAAADGGEQAGAADRLDRAVEVALGGQVHEFGDVDVDRAAFHAGVVLALQAAAGLHHGLGRGEALLHFVLARGPFDRIEGRRVLLGQLRPFLHRKVGVVGVGLEKGAGRRFQFFGGVDVGVHAVKFRQGTPVFLRFFFRRGP